MSVVLNINFWLPWGFNYVQYGLGVSTVCFPCNQADSWQKLIFHIQPTKYVGMKKLEKPEVILKICNFKRGIGIKSEKVCKQVRDQMDQKQV